MSSQSKATITKNQQPTIEKFNFDGHQLSRIFKGNWQLAGGHGVIQREQAFDVLFKYAKHGVNVFDVGDIYTGAERLLGDFLSLYKQKEGNDAVGKLRVHTKFVPDLNALHDLSKSDIRTVVERSLERLGVSSLHLVQFHWWDYEQGDFVQAARYLKELQDERLIEALGVTNFGCTHLRQLLDAGVEVKSNQIQFSLIDPRPYNGMLQLAQEAGVDLFCYGVVAGGLLGSSNPSYDSENRSHIKYGLIIDEVGQTYYRQLLHKLQSLATKHQTTVADIAIKFILQTEGVSSVILGPRNTRHLTELDALFSFQLSSSDYGELRELHASALKDITGDVYSYERVMDGPHGKIMKYNLNNMRV